MSDDSLHLSLILPWSWAPHALTAHAVDDLWHEALLILRVANQMQGHIPREGETEGPSARLEAKLDLALHLLARSVHAARPQPAAITLWAEGCDFAAAAKETAGVQGVLTLYPSSALPLPLHLPAQLTEATTAGLQAHWVGMAEAVTEAWEQWLFRQHRRSIQGRRAG